MCGIVGFAGRRPIDADSLGAMRDTMSHRGPDDRGLWYSADRSAGFGHRRLAIIDLSPGGHQPMADATGRVHITFNGEIYNFLELRAELEALGHSFHTASDTEVVLESYKEWGEDFVRRLVGMFAFGLYDERERCLLLARDRAGEKPLFVWERDGRLVFTSELKGLFALPEFPRTLDLTALQHYLAFAYVPQDLCLVAGVRKLLPGCMLRFDVDRGSVRRWRYWDLPRFDPDASRGRSADDLTDELEVLLLGAVRRQMIADVPIGILLSGGVDSSLVTAMASRATSRPVKTFTVTFPGHGHYDEAPFARLVASHFGTEHTELPAESASVSLLPELARQYDEPIGDSSMVPTFMVSRLIRQHATVALGGDGGDELFGGYPQYLWSTRLGKVQQIVPSLLRGTVSRGARWLPPGTRGRNYLIAIGGDRFGSLARLGLMFDQEWRSQLLALNGERHPTPDELRLAATEGASTMLQAAERLDFRSYMVDDILVKVDRASMLASLETRAPFLDPSIIEFVFRLVPDRLKVSLTRRKILLRRLAARLLPRKLDLERKQGFSLPLGSWFAGDWGPFMRGVLADAPPEIFRRSAIRNLLTGQEHRGNQIHRLFMLMMFELWRREYRIGL
jgi:asparagine synthase (glutamine-hydrolysing)